MRRAARDNNFIVVCSPFEADHQFVALQNQGIIDCVQSTDTDLIGQGIKRVIKQVSQDGKVTIMDHTTLVTKTLPKLFDRPDNPITPDELRHSLLDWCIFLGWCSLLFLYSYNYIQCK